MLNIVDNNSTLEIENKDLNGLPNVKFDLSIIDIIKGYKKQAAELVSYVENIIKTTDYNSIGNKYYNGNYTFEVAKNTISDGEYSEDFVILITTKTGLELASYGIKAWLDSKVKNTKVNKILDKLVDAVRRVQFFAPLKIFIRNLNNLFDSYPHHYTNQNHRLLN